MDRGVKLRGSASTKGRAKRRGNEAKWVRGFLTFFLLMGCLVGLALSHVWLRLQVIRLGYVLSATSKLQGQLEQENRELRLELATLTSPDRLETRAKDRLGLREPEKDQLVNLP